MHLVLFKEKKEKVPVLFYEQKKRKHLGFGKTTGKERKLDFMK